MACSAHLGCHIWVLAYYQRPYHTSIVYYRNRMRIWLCKIFYKRLFTALGNYRARIVRFLNSSFNLLYAVSIHNNSINYYIEIFFDFARNDKSAMRTVSFLPLAKVSLPLRGSELIHFLNSELVRFANS